LPARNNVIVVDLPGFGATPRLPGETSIRSLSEAVTTLIDEQGLRGIGAVGSSMGARLVLEQARRALQVLIRVVWTDFKEQVSRRLLSFA